MTRSPLQITLEDLFDASTCFYVSLDRLRIPQLEDFMPTGRDILLFHCNDPVVVPATLVRRPHAFSQAFVIANLLTSPLYSIGFKFFPGHLPGLNVDYVYWRSPRGIVTFIPKSIADYCILLHCRSKSGTAGCPQGEPRCVRRPHVQHSFVARGSVPGVMEFVGLFPACMDIHRATMFHSSWSKSKIFIIYDYISPRTKEYDP